MIKRPDAQEQSKIANTRGTAFASYIVKAREKAKKLFSRHFCFA
jgi:hypothetical protein